MLTEILKTRLRRAMTEKGVSNTALSDKANVTLQAVGLWLKTGKISLEKLVIVARVLGKSTDWMLGLEDSQRYGGKVIAIPPPQDLKNPMTELVDIAKNMSQQGQWELIGQARMLAARHPVSKANPAKS